MFSLKCFRAPSSITKQFATIACLFVAGIQPAYSETLSQAVHQALKNSDARKASIEGIEAQGHQVSVVQGAREPVVQLFGRVAVERVDDPGSLSASQNKNLSVARQLGIGVEYPLLDGLRALNTVYREATLLDSEIVRLADETETLALNAVQAYVNVVRHRNIVVIAEQNVQVHERIREQVEQQVAGGKLPESDRFRVSDKVVEARIALAEAKTSLANSVSNYGLVIGVTPRGTMAAPVNTRVPRSSAALQQAAVANSFRLKLAQKDIEALGYQERIDDAEWMPQVNLFAGADIGQDLDGSDNRESTLTAGVRLNWTLYKGNTRAATQARNRDLVMRAHYRKRQLEGEVLDFARRAWIAYSSAGERKVLLDLAETTSAQLAEAFRQEFEAAKRPLLQVLDAERDLFNIKVRRVNAEAALAFQSYRVLAAQNTLSTHFGLSHAGRSLNPVYRDRVVSAPRARFDVSAPDLQ